MQSTEHQPGTYVEVEVKSKPAISEEQLNAFVDNELGPDERAHVLSAMQDDSDLSQEVAALQQVNARIVLAYEETPTVSPQIKRGVPVGRIPLRLAAAFVILVIGSVLGWMLHQSNQLPTKPSFISLTQLNIKHPPDNKILIHINAMDKTRIVRALNDTEKLLVNAKKAGHALKVEVVANESGLGMLRKGSPYARRIHQIMVNNKNVSFLACGVAMETARLKEGHPIKLIPEAHKIHAALEQILLRLKEGWLYVRA